MIDENVNSMITLDLFGQGGMIYVWNKKIDIVNMISVDAHGVLGYGNFSQPGSPHRTDQLQLYSDKKFRSILFYHHDVEKNVVATTTF